MQASNRSGLKGESRPAKKKQGSADERPHTDALGAVEGAGAQHNFISKQASHTLKCTRQLSGTAKQLSAAEAASTKAEEDKTTAKKKRNSTDLSSQSPAKEQAASTSPEAASKGDEEGGSQAPSKLPKPGVTYKRFKKEASETQEQLSAFPREGALQDALQAFKADSKMKDKALALYVSSEVQPLHGTLSLLSNTLALSLSFLHLMLHTK